MDKATKRRILREWWKKAKRIHQPREMRLIKEEMQRDNSRLFSSFENREDRAELRGAMRNLIENIFAYAHWEGVRRGYKVARDMEKLRSGAQRNRAKKAIAGLIKMHPEWTTKQIFKMLDLAKVPIDRMNSMLPKHVTRWSHLSKEPSYKMLVSRIRARVRAVSRITEWETLISEHEKLRRKAPPEDTQN
jgi:hypothetical protein